MAALTCLARTAECALYVRDTPARHYIASTPESRQICNDPLLLGVAYTRALTKAVAATFTALAAAGAPETASLREESVCVAHVLRGGLNFGIREALADAFSWNRHGSLFLSAQRETTEHGWEIRESSYRKLSFAGDTFLVLGDVVATGTTLKHALHALGVAAKEANVQITGLIVFTIGGPRALEVVEAAAVEYRSIFPKFTHGTVVFMEGVFAMASAATPLRLSIADTDLLRTDTPLLAPEFLDSQYEAPSFPIERCTIYDAGSRAFASAEYLEDVVDYWTKVEALGRSGVTFVDFLQEHCPAAEPSRFGDASLEGVAQKQLEKLHRLHPH